MSPIVPHFASECLEDLKYKDKLMWPEIDKKYLINDKVNIVIQINGKKRMLINTDKDINEKELIEKIKFDSKMKKFIDENADNYDLIFFYHIRSSQYLPRYYRGKKIIEMGDLYSSNYIQTYKNLSIFNPLKYIYLLESFFVKKAETQIFFDFDKIILFSKNEIKKINRSFKKKIYQINISVNKFKDKFRFSRNNN